jgi:hypothetical protein
LKEENTMTEPAATQAMDDKSEWAGRKLAARARKVGLRLWPPSGDWVLVDEHGDEPGWSTIGDLRRTRAGRLFLRHGRD